MPSAATPKSTPFGVKLGHSTALSEVQGAEVSSVASNALQQLDMAQQSRPGLRTGPHSPGGTWERRRIPKHGDCEVQFRISWAHSFTYSSLSVCFKHLQMFQLLSTVSILRKMRKPVTVEMLGPAVCNWAQF